MLNLLIFVMTLTTSNGFAQNSEIEDCNPGRHGNGFHNNVLVSNNYNIYFTADYHLCELNTLTKTVKAVSYIPRSDALQAFDAIKQQYVSILPIFWGYSLTTINFKDFSRQDNQLYYKFKTDLHLPIDEGTRSSASDGIFYGFSGKSIVKYNYNSKSEPVEVLANFSDEKWNLDARDSSLIVSENKLYYTSALWLYELDLNTREKRQIAPLTEPGSKEPSSIRSITKVNGSIYAIKKSFDAIKIVKINPENGTTENLISCARNEFPESLTSIGVGNQSLAFETARHWDYQDGTAPAWANSIYTADLTKRTIDITWKSTPKLGSGCVFSNP